MVPILDVSKRCPICDLETDGFHRQMGMVSHEALIDRGVLDNAGNVSLASPVTALTSMAVTEDVIRASVVLPLPGGPTGSSCSGCLFLMISLII